MPGPLYVPLAGDYPSAAELDTFRPRAAVKPTDQGLISSTTLQNDNALSLAYEANTSYRLEYVLFVGGPAAADFKMAFTFGAGVTLSFAAVGPDPSISTLTSGIGIWQSRPNETVSPSNIIAYGLYDFSPITIIGSGRLKATGTPGTLTLQWAQNNSNATAVAVRADSYMELAIR